MSKRKPKKRRLPSGKRSTGKKPMTNRRSMDKVMSDLGKLLSQQDFQSIEEANEFLANNVMGAPLPSMAPETPLEEAQELIYEAWETNSPRQRVRLAKKALKISESCVDAYVILAEDDAKTVRDAHNLYAAGVRAGEQLLGDEYEETVGHFWGITSTRPYMRARAGMASTLWQMGQHTAAIAHYQELLRLNPMDNQGNRYLLFTHLLSHGLPDEIENLLAAYPDDASASWNYNWALYLFKYEQGSPQANKQLKVALGRNAHIPDFLLKRRRLPRQRPAYMSFGDDSEAVAYVHESQQVWESIPGALDWLEEQGG